MQMYLNTTIMAPTVKFPLYQSQALDMFVWIKQLGVPIPWMNLNTEKETIPYHINQNSKGKKKIPKSSLA